MLMEKEITTPIPRYGLTMQETAESLGISRISVWRLLKRGKLRSSNVLRHKIIAVSEIERFLRDTTEAA